MWPRIEWIRVLHSSTLDSPEPMNNRTGSDASPTHRPRHLIHRLTHVSIALRRQALLKANVYRLARSLKARLRADYEPNYIHRQYFKLFNSEAVDFFRSQLRQEMPEEVWDANLSVHLKGTFLCTQAVIPHMRRQRWGRIVNTVSRAAYKPTSLGLSDYAAAKAGIIGFSRAVAMEVGADGITLNCIAPGHVSGSGIGLVHGHPMPTPEQEQHRIDTEHQILEPHRMVTPEEIAGAVLYLVGPYAERVTGAVMHVNGGSYLPA